MEMIYGMLTVAYAKEEFMSVYLLLYLQNFYLANGEDNFGVWTHC